MRPPSRISIAVVSVVLLAECGHDITGPNTIAGSADTVFSGTVYPDGHTRWLFSMTSAATVAFSLVKADPPVRLGMSFGAFIAGGCSVTDEVEAAPGSAAPQISAAVDVGEKCIEVFDLGTVPVSGVSFSVRIHTGNGT